MLDAGAPVVQCTTNPRSREADEMRGRVLVARGRARASARGLALAH